MYRKTGVAPAVAPPKKRVPNPKPSKPAASIGPAVLSPREAAAYLNVSASTLKAWRRQDIGPAWRRRGARLISYFLADLDVLLQASARNPQRN